MYRVDVYTLVYKGKLDDALTITDEEVGWFDVAHLPENVLNNLHWLVPLAVDKIKHNEFNSCLVYYS